MQTQKKLTKRQRKALRGSNAAVLASRANGQRHGEYIGKPPVYAQIKEGMISTWRKVAPGVPFVRG